MHKKMFDGMPEQFYQFLAAATTTARTTTPPPTHNSSTTTNSLPLSFSLDNHAHHHFPAYSSPPHPTFDASYHHHLLHQHSQFLTRNNDEVVHNNKSVETNLIINPSSSSSSELPNSNTLQDGIIQRSSSMMLLPEIPWSNDEMLTLFRIRSSLDNTWFPDFIWENVSRKLAELGFKRSAEKCKEKYEEETRSFNCGIITDDCSNKNNNNNYRLFGELEVLCHNNNNNNNNINVNNNDNHHHHHLPPDVHDHLQTNEEEDDDEDDDPEVEEEKIGGERLEDDNDDDDDNEDNNVGDEQSLGDSEKTEEKNTKRVVRKRKRQKKFEMFKGFCEKIVNKMMDQQQQLHCKILHDMVKRDEEKIAKEEAWKKQEIERLEKELEFRAHEQAMAGDRQAKILDFLNKFNSSSSSHVLDSQSLKQTLEKLNKVPNIITCSNPSILSQDSIISAQLQPTSSCTTTIHDPNHAHTLVTHQIFPNIDPNSSANENLGFASPGRLVNPKLAPPIMSSSSMDQASQNPNPNPLISHNDSPHEFSKSDHTSTSATDHITDDFKTLEDQSGLTPVVGNGKDDTGRRWPRDEVLALINIRCSLFNNNNASGDIHNDKETFSKGPLWERISQKMMNLGYKRSAKRCKEKWENINKYFRKTKDLNKKRSIDSRTCPYFHQLSHLYSQGQGALVGPTDQPTMNLPSSPENRSMPFPEAQLGGSSALTNANDATRDMIMHASHGNEGVVQVPRFDFEF